jgi:hypothetical protein
VGVTHGASGNRSRLVQPSPTSLGIFFLSLCLCDSVAKHAKIRGIKPKSDRHNPKILVLWMATIPAKKFPRHFRTFSPFTHSTQSKVACISEKQFALLETGLRLGGWRIIKYRQNERL